MISAVPVRETVTHVPRVSHIWVFLGPRRVRLNLARRCHMTDTPPRNLGGSTSLREPWTSQGMRREQLSYFILIRHLGTGTLAGSTISDNFKAAVSLATQMGVHFHSRMHACIMENLACECTTKKGTQPTSERKSHGERKRKKG
jgi:hypothetical protein